MNTNEYSGGCQQPSATVNNVATDQTMNSQDNVANNQMSGYQYGSANSQAPNYQNYAGYQQVPNYQANAGYQQTPNYQNAGMYQQAPNYQNNAGYQQPKKAPNIFKQFAFSFVPPKYKELARAKVGIMILLVFLVVLIMVGLDFSKTMLNYIIEGGVSAVLNLMPDFELSNGEFSIDEEFFVKEDGLVLYMTDEIHEFDYYDVEYYIEYGYTQVMLVGRDNICSYEDGEYSEIDFADISELSFTKADIQKWADPFIWLVMLIVYVFIYFSKVLWYFLCASIYMLIGMLLAVIFGKKISAGHIFKAAVFAKIPFFIIAALFKLVGLDHSILGLLRAFITLLFFGFCVWCLPQKQQQYNNRQY